MVINNLELHHFRNYTHFEIEFSSHINLIQGDNGQGKTNLVEALHFICNLESFRTRKTLSLLQNQQETALLKSSIERKKILYSIQISLSNRGKRVLLNEKFSRKASEYILSFFSLVFTPEDVNLFRSGPSERRKFFDRTISFVDSSYFSDMQELNQILTQKNSSLKSKNTKQIPIWNELLSKVSQKIIYKRQIFIDEVNNHISSFFNKMTGRSERLLLVYQPSLGEKIGDKEKLDEVLHHYVKRELKYGYALVGPHRDDYRMYLDDRGDRDFFSQGEMRITNLSLKMAINQLLLERHNFYPVLIFDDLFSELDHGVSEKVLKLFTNLKNQIFVTSTDILTDLTLHGKTIHISNGQLANY